MVHQITSDEARLRLKALQDWIEGASIADLARDFGVSRQRMHQRVWRDFWILIQRLGYTKAEVERSVPSLWMEENQEELIEEIRSRYHHWLGLWSQEVARNKNRYPWTYRERL